MTRVNSEMASPSAPPRCQIISSQQMFQWLNQHVYAGCATGSPNNPICKAVAAAAGQQSPTLKTLASELYKIKEKDLIDYLQGDGRVQAQVLGNTLFAFLKCYFAPQNSDDKKTTRDEIDAMNRIKNWYIQNYLHSFGKASIPNVDFSAKDAQTIAANLDRVVCKNKDVYFSIVVWASLAGVAFLILGLLIGHHRGKVSCLRRLARS